MTVREGARTVALVALGPAWRRLRWRIERIAQEVVDADGRPAAAAVEVGAVREEVRGLRDHVDRLLGETRAHQDDIDNKLRLMAAQLAANDRRVADLERPAVDLRADDAERAEARRLIEEIRVEHGRARNGLATIAFYEERIARLERAGHA